MPVCADGPPGVPALIWADPPSSGPAASLLSALSLPVGFTASLRADTRPHAFPRSFPVYVPCERRINLLVPKQNRLVFSWELY